MQRRTFLKNTLLTTLAAPQLPRVLAERNAAAQATITVRPNQELGRIDKKVYGHFLEHLENVIYGGVFDPTSKKANPTGIRLDVVEAIREMGGAHVLRWPGGNFASYYHWQDGLGPRPNRPRRLDVAFNQYDSNHFGTEEYLELCRLLGCEPFITANLGSGTIQEACQWVEFCRREKRQPPVRIWGLGNEHYGPWQVGYFTAEEYARKADQFARFMRVVEPDLRFVGVGYAPALNDHGVTFDERWNEKVLAIAGKHFDWLTIHVYGHHYLPLGAKNFDSLMVTGQYFENEMRVMVGQVDEWERRAPRQKPLEIALEEWNSRHIREGGALWRNSPRTIMDALFVASSFNACHRLARRVTMSNYVFLLNTHAPISVVNDRVLRSATFDVFRLYATKGQEISLQTDVQGDRFTASLQKMPNWVTNDVSATAPRVDASATRSPDGKRYTLFLLNRYADQSAEVRLDMEGLRLPPKATLHTLQAPDLLAVNTLEKPDAVRSRSREVTLGSGPLSLPAASVNVLEWQV